MAETSEASRVDRFRILFEHSSDAHLIFDETGITDCNEATIKLLRAADRAQVLTLHPAVLSPEYQPDGRRSLEKSVEMDGRARALGYHRFEWVHRKLDGELFPVEVTLNSVEIDGKPAMIVVWHDLTEVKRVEAELRMRTEELGALNGQLAATNERLRRDLRAAARVQQALLPAALPDTDPVRLVWAFRPCEELAGDLLNIFVLDDRRVGFYVLDVSGHGVAASLLSVTVRHLLTPHGDHSLLKTPGAEEAARPADVIRRLNERLCSDRGEQFLTIFYGVLDLSTYRLCYANAGHPLPVVLSESSDVRELQTTGLPVGILDGAEYEDAEVRLAQGDRFWLYSDGLVEAMNAAGDQFGGERLLAAIRPSPPELLTDSIRRVLRDVEAWTGEAGPQDDISLVALEVGRS